MPKIDLREEKLPLFQPDGFGASKADFAELLNNGGRPIPHGEEARRAISNHEGWSRVLSLL